MEEITERISKPRWTPGEDQFLRANRKTMTIDEVALHLGRSEVSVQYRCDALRIEPPERRKTLTTSKYKYISIKYGETVVGRAKVARGSEEFRKMLDQVYIFIRPAILRGEKIIIEADVE